MAEPLKIPPSPSKPDLRTLCRQIIDPIQEFAAIVQRIQGQPSLMDDPLQLGHFSRAILALDEATAIAKRIDVTRRS